MEAQKSFKSIYWRFLEDMEEWLSDKAAAIKTLKDDCREVEEINRELDQRFFRMNLSLSNFEDFLTVWRLNLVFLYVLKIPLLAWKKVFADPMLFLVASILLNEAMDNYIDRQKKEGGNHSLSLAYVRVRATILELRKKVDS
jgi:hypothetical protein